MFTLNRLSLLGLGAGLVLVGCASPTDETAESTDVSSAGLTAEANPEQTINDENGVPLSAEETAATEASDPQSPADPAQTEEGPTDSRSDKIFLGGGWGLGGLGGWGLGGFRGGWGGWGGGFGVPIGGFYGGGFYPGFGGFGVARGIGWGGGWAGGCGLYGCGGFW